MGRAARPPRRQPRPLLGRRPAPRRPKPPSCYIFHTTGEPDFDKVLRYYREGELGPHYLIDLDGTVFRLVPEDRVAWHAKIEPAEAGLYLGGWSSWRGWVWPPGAKAPQRAAPVELEGGAFRGYLPWRRRWPGKESPLELAAGARPNYSSVGVELLQPRRPGARIFTDEQYASARELFLEGAARHGFPAEPARALGHSDVSPMRRSRASGGWDPGQGFDWSRVAGPGATLAG